jgi:predicted thioesterase
VNQLRPGLKGGASEPVDDSNLASTLKSGHVPVYSTPAMISLMERAALAALEGLLPDGSESVGIRVEVRHLAATPPGLEVRAEAELVEVDGRCLVFRVQAFDPVEKIGEGIHERFVVDLPRLLARARGKKTPPPAPPRRGEGRTNGGGLS